MDFDFGMIVYLLLLAVITCLNNAGGTNYSQLSDEQLVDHIREEKINLGDDLRPGPQSYQLILKIDEAIYRGVLTSVHDSRVYYQDQLATELYKAIGCNEDIRLPSTIYKARAKNYFEFHQFYAPVPDWLPSSLTEKQTYTKMDRLSNAPYQHSEDELENIKSEPVVDKKRPNPEQQPSIEHTIGKNKGTHSEIQRSRTNEKNIQEIKARHRFNWVRKIFKSR